MQLSLYLPRNPCIFPSSVSPELAGGLDGLAEGSGVGLCLEDVGDEGVLRGVHDERAVRHVLPDAQERQKPERKRSQMDGKVFYYPASVQDSGPLTVKQSADI